MYTCILIYTCILTYTREVMLNIQYILYTHISFNILIYTREVILHIYIYIFIHRHLEMCECA